VKFEQLDLLELVLAEDNRGVLSSGSGFGAEASRPRGHVNGKFFSGWFRRGRDYATSTSAVGVSQKSVFSILKRSAANFALARAG